MRAFWIWMVILATATSATRGVVKYPQQHHKSIKHQQQQQAQHSIKHQSLKQPAFGNQRILRIQGTSQPNNFGGHHKRIRNRPNVAIPKGHSKEEFPGLGKNYPAVPFFNGPSTNHIKHLPRPPPHVYHKIPSYGSAFPYKSLNAFWATNGQLPGRKPTSTPIHRPTKQTVQATHAAPLASVSPGLTKTASASATHYSPTFASFSLGSGSGPVRQIITSGEDGPIKEVPAPDLSPKSVSAGLTLSESHMPHVTSDLFTGIKSGGSSLEGLTNIPTIDMNSFVKDASLDLNHFGKDSFGGVSSDSSATSFGKGQTVELPEFEQETSVDLSDLFKEPEESEKLSTSYEVTEHHHHLPSSNYLIKSLEGPKLYYAPDPDPSLPVYKVPPTKDPHSTPSTGQTISSLYIPQYTGGYSYLQGGSVGGALGLYPLFQSYPTVLSQVPQPLVTYVGQPQSGAGNDYYHASSASDSGSAVTSEIGDITQYLQNPEIHNLLHNSPDSHHHAHDSSHSSATNYATQIRQPEQSAQTQYQTYFQNAHYKPYAYVGSSGQRSAPQTFDTSEGPNYEPEASESRNSLTVIRQTPEGTAGSSSGKDSLPEDSDSNDLNFPASEQPEPLSEMAEDEPQVYHFKNIPEVPVYSSLPSEEAAKTLAGLQAAGSVASDYLNKIKVLRGGQGSEQEDQEDEVKNEEEEEGKAFEEIRGTEEVTEKDHIKNMGYYQFSGFKKLDEIETEVEQEKEEIEIETSNATTAAEEKGTDIADEEQAESTAAGSLEVRQITSKHRRHKFPSRSSRGNVKSSKIDFAQEGVSSDESASMAFKEDPSNETFGKRLRPKK